MKRKNRNGVSAVDVIVTIVVLVALVALLLPAVQPTCTSNRRSQCKNNLKQIGLALMNYHEVARTLPPGWVVSATEGKSNGFGWGMMILPYLDQAPLFKKLNSKRPLADPHSDNSMLAATIVTVYRCPDDRGDEQSESRWLPLIGTTNYVGNFGVGIPSTYSSIEDSSGNRLHTRFVQGIFGANTKIRIRDCKDGMSNVVLVGERRLPIAGTDWPLGKVEGNFNSYWAGLPNVEKMSPLTVVATVTGGSPELCDEDDALNMHGDLNGLLSESRRHLLPFFAINRNSKGEELVEVDRSSPVTAGFSSWHTGGCQFVLGDGTVRFISENIDPIIFANMMRRSDGETLGEF
jgi:hypothetical protein